MEHWADWSSNDIDNCGLAGPAGLHGLWQRCGFQGRGGEIPTWLGLEPKYRDAWVKAAGVIWDLATTGRAELI